jgi:cysteine desulfurase
MAYNTSFSNESIQCPNFDIKPVILYSVFTMKSPIYLDYAATTPVDPRVAAAMSNCLTLDGAFGNAASRHAYGKAASELIDQAREQVAATINAEPSEIIFTSGATESINLAIKGAALMHQRKGKHIVTVKTEHKATLDACQYLEKEGFAVTYLTPDKNGLVDMQQLQSALRDDTMLVSIMHVNNETGVIQDIPAIGAMLEERGILLHVDAAQSIGKLNVNVQAMKAHLISLSAHKAYGPKGVGALYLRKKPRVRVQPFIHGGGQEQGMRSGTLPTHQIVGMGAAFHLAQQDIAKDAARITQYRDLFIQALAKIPCCYINAPLDDTVPHIINVRFDGMVADAILAALPDIATSTASACQGKGTEGSYVLRAMGLTDAEVKSAIRFSFGRFTTEDQIIKVVEQIRRLFR